MTRLALFLQIIFLSGCSLKLELIIVNNTGDKISVLNRPSLDYGQAIRIDFPAERSGYELLIDSRGCSFIYRMALPDRSYMASKKYSDPISMQIEPDGVLYLLPPNSDVPADIDLLKRDQGKGYPLKPVSITCGKDAGES